MSYQFQHELEKMLGTDGYALVAVYDQPGDIYGEYFIACGAEGLANFAEIAGESRGEYWIDQCDGDTAIIFDSEEVAYIRRIYNYKVNEISEHGHSYEYDMNGGLFDENGIYAANTLARNVFENHCSDSLWVSEPYFPSWSRD